MQGGARKEVGKTTLHALHVRVGGGHELENGACLKKVLCLGMTWNDVASSAISLFHLTFCRSACIVTMTNEA